MIPINGIGSGQMPGKAARERFVCIGAGGHARSVAELIAAQDRFECVGFLDSDPAQSGKILFGIPVLGGDDQLPSMIDRGVRRFLITIGQGGKPNLWEKRAQKFRDARSCGLQPVTLVHPSANLSRFAEIGEGVVIMPAAVVNAGARIADNVIINTGSIIEHDCTIGSHCHVATGAVLCGAVHVDEGAHIGAGCVVRQLVHIGCGAVIGAGAVVVSNVEPGIIVAGIPARPI